MNHRSLALAVLFFVLVAFLFSYASAATTLQFDKTGTVSSVIDGSSFTLASGETVKLAGIDTPSPGAPGYAESKNYLASMLIQGITVYLDVDTLTVNDSQGRLLCVAYLDYNSTHYENVNQAMLENHYAAPSSVSNTDFNPATWTWFVPKQSPSPSPVAIATAAPTVTPTPTPFNAPSPSVNPSSVNPSIPEFPATMGLIIVVMATLVTITLIGQVYRRRKK